MAKKLTRSQLVKKLDTVFSQYIRLKDSKDGIGTCVTCGKQDHIKNLQAGHFQSRKHYSTRWDERNVKIQCSACNVFRYGEQYLFSLKLGNKLSEELLAKSREVVKFADVDLLDMIIHYSNEVKKLT
jgi:5-methylcytosine-specific restriction endonuclease McrA